MFNSNDTLICIISIHHTLTNHHHSPAHFPLISIISLQAECIHFFLNDWF